MSTSVTFGENTFEGNGRNLEFKLVEIPNSTEGNKESKEFGRIYSVHSSKSGALEFKQVSQLSFVS